MEYIVEECSDQDGYQGALSRPRNVTVQFHLVVPEDRTQPARLEYQMDEEIKSYEIYSASGLIPGNDGFLPRSRSLPIEGLEDIFAWFDEVNLWEWQPPSEVKIEYDKVPEGVVWSSLLELDVRYKHVDSWLPDYQNKWFLEVVRGGRCFRQELNVFGAPAPSVYAFEEGAWNPIRTELVPILANHLMFLTNDPLIVGLTKRLLRLVPKKKPKPQIAKFDDGQGTRYEVDYERMVARRFTRNHGLGLGRLGLLAPKVTEVPISEYDRMRLWGALMGFKSTDSGLMPVYPMDAISDLEATPSMPGRKWSGDVCDGKRRWRFPVGRVTVDDEALRQRFAEAFTCLFSVLEPGVRSKGPLPLIAMPVMRHIPGGVAPLPVESVRSWFAPLYTNSPGERILAYRAKIWRYEAWDGALLGDIECMLKTEADCWYQEAASLGNPTAMVIVADRLLGLVRNQYAPSPKANVDGLARRYYEAAFNAGYLPAALGLGYVNQHGIGGSIDKVAAVAYYLQFLEGERSSLKEDRLLAYTALADLHLDRHGPVYDLDEGNRYRDLASAIVAQRNLIEVQDEMRRCQDSLDEKMSKHQSAMARLAEAPNFKRVLPHPVGSCKIGTLEDFSTFVSGGSPEESESVYLPLFCAELLYEGKSVGSISCLNLSWVQQLDRPTWVHVSIPDCGSTYRTTFGIHQSFAGQAFFDNFEVGARSDEGTYATKHRLYLGLREAVAGTPEWDRHWAIYRQLIALVRGRLGDFSNPRHPARRMYVDHLKEAGLEPSPFIRDLTVKVGSVGHAEMVRRYQLCKVLARTFANHEALSDFAIAEASKVTAMNMPALERKPDGSMTLESQRKLFALTEAYLAKVFPVYSGVDHFMDANKLPLVPRPR
jgi:hypothetical protein